MTSAEPSESCPDESSSFRFSACLVAWKLDFDVVAVAVFLLSKLKAIFKGPGVQSGSELSIEVTEDTDFGSVSGML